MLQKLSISNKCFQLSIHQRILKKGSQFAQMLSSCFQY